MNKMIWVVFWLGIAIYLFWVTREGYDNMSHTVNLPINTTYSCKNICGPPSRCSITGEQCTSDIDCSGCQPGKRQKSESILTAVPYNDAGKMSDNMTPSFSVLTTDTGTRAFQFQKDNVPPPNYNQGINTWRSSFDKEMLLYDKRYNPQFGTLQNIPQYPSTPSLTGEFMVTGPLASNS